jgi:hypothetical protein
LLRGLARLDHVSGAYGLQDCKRVLKILQIGRDQLSSLLDERGANSPILGGNRKTGKGHEMTNDHKLAKRAHKLGYRYITRWPVPTIGTEHILEHKDGDRHFRSMDEVERFIGEQEIAKLERQTNEGARYPTKTAW